MLCSNCLKKILEGEEVAKTSGYWKVNGWGRYGNEIYCKKCAIKKQDRRDLIFNKLFALFLMIWNKNNL